MQNIFKYFTLDSPTSAIYSKWFVDSFPHTEFTEINKILYFFLEYCATLSIPSKREYLTVFLRTELKKLVRKYNIRIDTLTANFNYEEIAAFEQAIQVISNTTLSTYDSYCSVEVLEDHNAFKILLAEFMNENMRTRITSIFTEQFSNMSQGGDMLEVADQTEIELSTIREIYDISKIEDLDFSLGKDQKLKDSKARILAKTGIPAIDEDYGGIFSKALITFAGQPGSGKTRFLLSNFIYPALVKYKLDVRLDELELNDYEVRNILLAIHIAKLYKIKITDKSMNQEGDLTEEQKKIVESARIDLFESGKYGNFHLCIKDLVLEDMYKKIKSFKKANPSLELWCVDYTGLIKSKPKNKYEIKNEAGIINEALILGKKLAKELDICSVFVNQFNERGNDKALAGKNITVGDIHGGQSIQRHTDYDLSITYTEEQAAANLRMLSTTKTRAAKGFKFVPLSVDLSIARFTQIEKFEERG